MEGYGIISAEGNVWKGNYLTKPMYKNITIVNGISDNRKLLSQFMRRIGIADLGKSSTLELTQQPKIVSNNAGNDCQYETKSGKNIRKT